MRKYSPNVIPLFIFYYGWLMLFIDVIGAKLTHGYGTMPLNVHASSTRLSSLVKCSASHAPSRAPTVCCRHADNNEVIGAKPYHYYSWGKCLIATYVQIAT